MGRLLHGCTAALVRPLVLGPSAVVELKGLLLGRWNCLGVKGLPFWGPPGKDGTMFWGVNYHPVRSILDIQCPG